MSGEAGVAPHSPEAEASVVGQMLAESRVVGEVIGTLLEPAHFFVPAFRALYAEIVTAYYADDPIDALTIGELCAKALGRTWRCEERVAVARVQALAVEWRVAGGSATAHAKLVKRDADYRALLDLAVSVQRGVAEETESPEDLAGVTSQTAMKIATNTLLTQEIVTYEELGRNFVRQQRRLMAARAAGVELGAYFDLAFLDGYLRGLQPGELFVLAGEAGAGKSAVAFKAAQLFAERQARAPVARRVGALVLSLEMSEEPTSTRLAQAITGLDGGRLREGRTDEGELEAAIEAWATRKGIPLFFNFASYMRAGQMRALIVEAIRRHNVGVVVVDHMRYFAMEGRFQTAAEEDEAKALFLKTQIAKDLNVAVILLAHTTKAIEGREDRRPRLSDLRGGGLVAAHADFVGFIHRPYNSASQQQIEDGVVSRTDADLIMAKSRHGLDGSCRFFFDASAMTIYALLIAALLWLGAVPPAADQLNPSPRSQSANA